MIQLIKWVHIRVLAWEKWVIMYWLEKVYILDKAIIIYGNMIRNDKILVLNNKFPNENGRKVPCFCSVKLNKVELIREIKKLKQLYRGVRISFRYMFVRQNMLITSIWPFPSTD